MRFDIIHAHSASMRELENEKGSLHLMYKPTAKHLILIYFNHVVYLLKSSEISLKTEFIARKLNISVRQTQRNIRELLDDDSITLIGYKNKVPVYKVNHLYNHKKDYIIPLSLIANESLDLKFKLFILKLHMLQDAQSKAITTFSSERALRDSVCKDHYDLTANISTLETFQLIQYKNNIATINLQFIYKVLDRQDLESYRIKELQTDAKGLDYEQAIKSMAKELHETRSLLQQVLEKGRRD